MNPQAYEVVIRPLAEEEGGGFLATVAELPGCMSDGESPQEALEGRGRVLDRDLPQGRAGGAGAGARRRCGGSKEGGFQLSLE